MRLEVSLQARLEQKLRLAPQIIQSIEILQLAALELQDLVKEALEENPALEEDQGAEPTESEEQPETDLEREIEGLEQVDAVWNDYFSPAGRPGRGTDGDDRKWEAMQNTAAPPISLPEYLIQQLHLLELSTQIPRQSLASLILVSSQSREEVLSRMRALTEFIIYNLDENGYLQSSLEEIVEAFLAQGAGGAEASEVDGRGNDSGSAEPVAPAIEAAGLTESGAAPEDPPAPPIPGSRPLAEPETPEAPADQMQPAAEPPPVVQVPSPEGDNGVETPEVAAGDVPVGAASSTDGAGFTLAAAEEALKIIQTFDPPGVGGRSLKEVLLLQLGSDPKLYQEERRIIENHLPDIQGNRFPKIAKAMGMDLEEIKERIAFVRMLNPRPGSLFAPKAAHYIIPDVVVVELDGEYEVRLEDAYVPRLHISPHYRRMLAEERDNPKVREFIKKKIEAAKWLIESIEQRQNTLLRISREIVSVQRDFLDYGLEHLKPLKMQHIADRVGVHVSTVSRALSDKYIQTPRGIYSMKFFFTGGTVSQDGTMESTVSIKQKVRDIVDKEDKKHPLSDEEIARVLRRDQGLEIARRTVTKYRKQLSIPSSRQRRLY